MAAFCLMTGLSPSEANALTRIEINAFIKMAKRTRR